MGFTFNLIFAAAIFAGFLAFAAWSKHRRNVAWKEVAQTLGLQYRQNIDTNLGEIDGLLDGVRVTVRTLIEGGGKSKSTYTAVSAQITGKPPLSMKISHEGLFQKMGKVFGGKDIQVGDHALDSQFLFVGSNPRVIRTLVTTPAVKDALLSTQKRCKSLQVELGEVCLKEADVGENRDQLVAYIRMSIHLAATIGNATSGPAQLAPPVEPRLPAPSTRPAQHSNILTGATDAPEDWW